MSSLSEPGKIQRWGCARTLAFGVALLSRYGHGASKGSPANDDICTKLGNTKTAKDSDQSVSGELQLIGLRRCISHGRGEMQDVCMVLGKDADFWGFGAGAKPASGTIEHGVQG